jgi:hypothetical protein
LTRDKPQSPDSTAGVAKSNLTVVRECSVKAEFGSGIGLPWLPAARIDEDAGHAVIGLRWIPEVEENANIVLAEATGQIEPVPRPISNTLRLSF